MDQWPYASGIPQSPASALRLLKIDYEREWRAEQRGLKLICLKMLEEYIASLERENESLRSQNT